MLKRFTAGLLAVCMLFALTGCTNSDDRAKRKEALRALHGEDLGYQLTNGTSAAAQELYNDGETWISFVGITGDADEPQLALAVKNGTRKSINLSLQRCSINGWSMDGWLDTYEIKGHAVTIVWITADGEFDLVGIADIAGIQLELEIYDDSYNTIATVSADIATNAADVDTDYTSTGFTVLKDDSYQIDVMLSDVYGREQLCVYTENNSDRDVYVNVSDVEVNGEDVEYWCYDPVSAQERRMSVDRIYDPDTYDSIELQDTDEITATVQIVDEDTGLLIKNQEVSFHAGALRAQ